MNFYKHHIGDYDADTAHLTWLEDMAYTRLMRLYYRRESPIPADISKACRLVRATSKQEREAVENVLNEFFTLDLDGWHNKRCDDEIGAALSKADKNREVGKLGGRPRKKETMMVSENNHDGFKKEPHNNPSQTPDTRHQTEAIASGVPTSTGVEIETKKQLAPDPGCLSPTARVCLGLKSMGYSDTNPHDAKLVALIDAGLTPDEILAAGQSGKGKAKGFRWVLATAEGRRRDAANVVPLPAAATVSPGSSRLSPAGQQTAAAAERLLKAMEGQA